jgi:thioredoxin reductase (NADPH)
VQDAVELEVAGAGRIVKLAGGRTLSASCVLIASGVSYRHLSTPGFEEFTGRGVYYGAALTEARACTDQEVVIIGGANSAGQCAVHFSGYARKVTMLVRGSGLEASMSQYLIDQLGALPNVEVLTGTQATQALGEDHLSALAVNGPTGERELRADACFVFIGAQPRTDWLDGVVRRDERGFLLAGPDVSGDGWPLDRSPHLLETSVPGVFAAGDVRSRSMKRVASAVGEGSMVVSFVHQYLGDL